MSANEKERSFDPASITLRPVTAADDSFLYRVYASTREPEMALTGWLPVQQQAFLRMQFNLQKESYADQFRGADHVIILVAGQPVGRMMIDRTSEEEIRGVDIALLPRSRCSGVGTLLINNLLDEAAKTGKPFRIRVEKYNGRALSLYDRLGFLKTGEGETHISMEWQPRES